MKRLAQCVALFASTALAAEAHAQSFVNGCTLQPTQKTTNVYFANGVWTSYDAANITKEKISVAYKASLEGQYQGERFDFRVAYNYNAGAYTDVVEVLYQKMIEQGVDREGVSAFQILSLFRQGLSNANIRRIIARSVRATARVSTVFTDAVLRILGQAMTDAEARAISGQQSTNAQHVNYYSSDIQAGTRVIVIAHSQGNLFTNAALTATAQALPNQSGSLGMIGVATPARAQFRNSVYRTANDDLVIGALRLISTVLPSNIDNRPPTGDDFRSFTNHLFERDYFDPRLPSRAAIDSELSRLVSTLPFPPRVAGQGAIRATLVWDSQPDVDLHAFEPNGTHVYYANRTGSSGMLDVDDVTGFGPENYVVPCDRVLPGTYRIGINYFSGSAPTTATVSLFLGDGMIPPPVTRVLPRALGSSGNGNPTIVYTVVVTVDGQGRVRYVVQQ